MKLSDYEQSPLVRLLLIGNSGTGKTGALISLVKAGYNVRILNFDKIGISVLFHHLPKKLRAKISVLNFEDNVALVRAMPVPRGPISAAIQAAKALDHWKDESEDLGPTSAWGVDDVLVVDSLTFMGRAILYNAMFQRGWDQPRPPHPQEWQAAGMSQMAFLDRFSALLPCHLVCTSHIKLIGGDEDVRFEELQRDASPEKEASREARGKLMPLMGYPSLAGRQIAMQAGRWFDYILRTYVEPIGKGKRFMTYRSDGLIEAKCPLPDMPDPLPVETGLAELFKRVKESAQ